MFRVVAGVSLLYPALLSGHDGQIRSQGHIQRSGEISGMRLRGMACPEVHDTNLVLWGSGEGYGMG